MIQCSSKWYDHPEKSSINNVRSKNDLSARGNPTELRHKDSSCPTASTLLVAGSYQLSGRQGYSGVGGRDRQQGDSFVVLRKRNTKCQEGKVESEMKVIVLNC